MKKALITGVSGQDGSYLAEFLLSKNYEVHGIVRRSSIIKTDRIEHIYQDPHEKEVRFHLHYGDLTDSGNIYRLISKIKPNEIYNLGAQSHVKVSFDVPEYSVNVDALGTLRILDAVRENNFDCKIYQASSSEMFGNTDDFPITEKTPFQPQSPYAAAKVFSYWVTKNYREAYNLFTANGILFNHESPRRGETFVTRKISRAVASIHNGEQNEIYLGNLSAERDWGFAPDYVKGMWSMLQCESPDDYILATNTCHSVREFCELAFQLIGINLEWNGTGVDEVGYDSSTGKKLVLVDPMYFRPTELHKLMGDYSKASNELAWKPECDFESLVKLMVESDLRGGNIERFFK